MSDVARVMVYGASGHTGQLVVRDLIARGYAPLLAGRNRESLERVAASMGRSSPMSVVALDNTAALYSALENTDVLVNCAGPLNDTSFVLASAAIDQEVHYFDTNAVEQIAAKRLFDDLHGAARRSGVAVVPGMATFGGLGDLMASHSLRGIGQITSVTISYLVKGWIPTRGSQATAAGVQGAPRLIFNDGSFSVGCEPARLGRFDFGSPFGVIDVVENYPGVDVATVPRHVSAKHVAVQMALSTLQEFRSLEPEHAAQVDGRIRKNTEFVVAVDTHYRGGHRRTVAQGKDIYGFTATILGNAVDRVTHGPGMSGVLSPSQLFDSAEFLEALMAQGLRLHGEELSSAAGLAELSAA
jgi:hypothetical protein